jgi:DNA-binding NarL/FixJ family response regulator
MSQIRVLLADDHPALRIGLRVLLEQAPGIAVVAEASDGEEALTLAKELRPQVAVLDCQLPRLAGAAVAAALRRAGLPVRVLALSAYSDDVHLRSMLEAGAVGYLIKDEAAEVIADAVRAAVRGDIWFSPAVAARADAWARGEWGLPVVLTEREAEVLRLVAGGKANKEIARALAVAERTVEFHISNLLAKLGVASRVEAAVWAKDHGLC